MTDQELIKGCKQNKRRSQNALYKKYFPLMSSIAKRYCSNEEDILQTINYGFFKVLQNLDKYKPDNNLATWIRRIMINHIIDEYRKQKKHFSNVHIQYDENIDSVLSDYNLAEKKWEENELRSWLNRLPDMTKTVFNMFAIDGYSHKEISKELNITTGTSKWHVSDARKKLRGMMISESNEKKMIEVPYER